MFSIPSYPQGDGWITGPIYKLRKSDSLKMEAQDGLQIDCGERAGKVRILHLVLTTYYM